VTCVFPVALEPVACNDFRSFKDGEAGSTSVILVGTECKIGVYEIMDPVLGSTVSPAPAGRGDIDRSLFGAPRCMIQEGFRVELHSS
jgi:hypothetical protein